MAIDYAVLKAAILADPVLSAFPAGSDGSYAIAAELNKAAVPEVIVWRTSVAVEDIMRNGMDWTRVDNLTVGKARIWDWLSRLGSFNPAKINIRSGIDAAWVGTAADLAVRAMIYTHCKRAATVVEAMFSSGGAGTTAAPTTMTFEGAITWQVVDAARSS